MVWFLVSDGISLSISHVSYTAMALAAPEVVALSTLGFDPVEKRDKLVVIVAPAPDDDEGMLALKELLSPSLTGEAIQQPIVLLNYHMYPPPSSGLADFETAYHLRLLTVQYMSRAVAERALEEVKDDQEEEEVEDESSGADKSDEDSKNHDALESAMKHAHDVGMNQGTTRAMVIRAYPRPWHVFVDLSPDTDADFEVAATFDNEPSLDELNVAIVECLEGSEREDELVAQQMQQALEEGQLDRVSDMVGEALEGDDDEDDFDMFEEDSV